MTLNEMVFLSTLDGRIVAWAIDILAQAFGQSNPTLLRILPHLPDHEKRISRKSTASIPNVIAFSSWYLFPSSHLIP
jgi:hypothetical protein